MENMGSGAQGYPASAASWQPMTETCRRIKRGESRTSISSLSSPAPAPALSSSKLATMSGCGSGSCSNRDGCQCSTGCGCCKALSAPTLRNYMSAENDCKCGSSCNCADCDCHK